MTVYKLTRQNMQTQNDMQWVLGVPNTATGEGNGLCTDGVLHYYYSAAEAVLFNLIHGNYSNPRLFEAETPEEVATDGLKGGCKTLTLIKEILLPEISTEKRVEFAIRCALQVYKDESFVQWANQWLEGTDRSREAARAAEAAEAAWAAEAARAAAWAAEAARAAETAAWAARAAEAAGRQAIVNALKGSGLL